MTRPRTCYPARLGVTTATMIFMAAISLGVQVPAFAQPPAAAPTVSFNKEIRPILSDKCFFCHGPDAAKREADLRLDQRDAAVASGAIVPGKATESEVIRRVQSDDPEQRMPPAHAKLATLTEAEVNALKTWIDQGAVYENHWAFIPVVPRQTNDANISRYVDEQIQKALADRGLTQRPTASRTTLLRRLHFDLTGLPPAASDVEAFLNRSFNAEQQDAVTAEIVDRLLASPQYGERMAVDWLDSSRYADSFGFQVDREREMWPWRDWVIQSFNSNQPFDQFVTWQLAGDLLPNASQDQILATAFNRLHQQEAEGGSVEEEYRVEYVSDRVQTFATTFLGLTFECARCHDHKYDPITQKEYYQLFAMFQNIDEAGLYSYFTPSPPTPALTLTDMTTDERLKTLEQKVAELEQISAGLKDTRQNAFQTWLANAKPETLVLTPIELARFGFDQAENGVIANAINADQPASLKGDNQLVEGQTGKAVQFTGDDPVDLPLGNFHRHEPFSISLWLQTPDEKSRAVVLHRSRAWTDAASRGYELLIEDGKLKWSLIHFWPGNAVSIRTQQKVPLKEWLHVSMSHDGSGRASGLAVYINGQPAECEIIKDHLTREITGGGGDNIALGERFRDRGFREGAIDDLRVFGSDLTALAAMAIYDESRARAEIRETTASFQKNPAESPNSRIEFDKLFDWYLHTQDSEWKAHRERLLAARVELAQFYQGLKEIMVMRELPQPKKAYVLFRG